MSATASASIPIACRICGLVHAIEPLEPGRIARCRRCGSTIIEEGHASLERTAAFALTALLFYGPANIFPILRLNMYGATSENTVWEGCVRLYRYGEYAVALVVFLASIAIPLLKILGLIFLVASVRLRTTRWGKFRTWLVHAIDGIGRWAMLDVFALAILVSLVKLERMATVIPGEGLLAFALVVVCTILASSSFDPRLLWEGRDL